jgi:hypothetical protein
MKPAWMSEFHSESCKNIFDTCTRFNMKLISNTEKYLKEPALQEESRHALLAKKQRLEGVLSGEIK